MQMNFPVLTLLMHLHKIQASNIIPLISQDLYHTSPGLAIWPSVQPGAIDHCIYYARWELQLRSELFKSCKRLNSLFTKEHIMFQSSSVTNMNYIWSL